MQFAFKKNLTLKMRPKNYLKLLLIVPLVSCGGGDSDSGSEEPPPPPPPQDTRGTINNSVR